MSRRDDLVQIPQWRGFFVCHSPSGSGCFAFQRSNKTATASDTPTANPAPISTTPISTGINATCCCHKSLDNTTHWRQVHFYAHSSSKGIDAGRITVHDTGPLIQNGDWRDEPMPYPPATESSAGDLKRAAAEQAVGGWFDSIRGSHQTHCGI